MKRKCATAIPVLLAAIGLTFGGQASAAEGKSAVPSSFELDYDAAIASDGGNLWLATVGKKGKGFRVQVQVRDGDGWRSLPGRPKTTLNSPFHLIAHKPAGKKNARPCLGDSTRTGRVRVLRG